MSGALHYWHNLNVVSFNVVYIVVYEVLGITFSP